MDLYIFEDYRAGVAFMTETKSLDCVIISRSEIEKMSERSFDRIYAMGTKPLSQKEIDKLLHCSLNIHQMKKWNDIENHFRKIGAIH